MEKEIIQWWQSNIEVKLTITPDEFEKLEEKAIRELWKDVDVPGYRPGKAPIEDIKKRINTEYLQWAIYEQAVNDALKDAVKEYQLIWEIYDINNEKKWDNVVITFKVDKYPVVEVKNENYKSVEPTLPDENVNEEDVEKAVKWLQTQFSEYKDVEKVDTEKTYTKLELEYLNDKWEKVGDGKVFLAKEDYAEFPMLKENFDGKKVWDFVEFDYSDKLPTLLQYFKKDKDELKIAKVKATITEIKESHLPEVNLDNIEKWFGKRYEDLEWFYEEIKNTLQIEKRRTELNKFVEDLVKKINDSFELIIPKTLIDQEIKQRIDTLKQRYGGAKNFERMLKSMKPEEVKKFYEDLTTAAKESIWNFLILMKYAELNKLIDKIDFKKDLDLEEKLLSLFKKEDKKSK